MVKFVGAGQGAKALVAEIIVGELARHIGLPVPELALVEVDVSFGRTEPDPEIQDLLRTSHGTNVGMRLLGGALNYDPVAAVDLVTPELAARIVWLDAFVMNIDRTARNTNLMVVDEQVWLIDHGAALYFHHDWNRATPESIVRPLSQIDQHVLLPVAADLGDAHQAMSRALDRRVLAAVLAAVPDELLMHAPHGVAPDFGSPAQCRDAYIAALGQRLETRAFAVIAEQARCEAQA